MGDLPLDTFASWADRAATHARCGAGAHRARAAAAAARTRNPLDGAVTGRSPYPTPGLVSLREVLALWTGAGLERRVSSTGSSTSSRATGRHLLRYLETKAHHNPVTLGCYPRRHCGLFSDRTCNRMCAGGTRRHRTDNNCTRTHR